MGQQPILRETLLFYGTAAEAEQHKFVVKKTKQNKNTAKTDGIAEVFNWNKLVYENMLNIIQNTLELSSTETYSLVLM